MAYMFPILSKRQLREVPPVSWSRLQQDWRFNADDLISIKPILVAALVLGIFLGVIWIWKAGRTRQVLRLGRPRSSPVHIFNEVVEGLGLTLADRMLLIRVAHQQALPSPLTLVLSEATFGHHLEQYTQAVGAKRRAKIQGRVARIKRVLFGVARD